MCRWLIERRRLPFVQTLRLLLRGDVPDYKRRKPYLRRSTGDGHGLPARSSNAVWPGRAHEGVCGFSSLGT
ncbi:uncharacterized protein PHACADRAFT_255236 [Phanerochaete carnosa HHB-10118-sp]|uniref:Uncharacterized protein n=1 Tax=Phanerochaete carnosa (strain HHB-10118-sp) TaxID=650164 RepID=K5WWX9_PHACS|nr:uncharacterized protein PHACADRAFT_255236 [Phanerochaete carnosa HHB-10118-sp]EKM54977.1 hypothetical protein PHACADRAFT_255236 [Phanerochaete carnosa HHB-10118-sp]